MFFKRKKISDYLNDEQFVKEIETLKKIHQDELKSKAIVEDIVLQPEPLPEKVFEPEPVLPEPDIAIVETAHVEPANFSLEQLLSIPIKEEKFDSEEAEANEISLKMFESAVEDMIKKEVIEDQPNIEPEIVEKVTVETKCQDLRNEVPIKVEVVLPEKSELIENESIGVTPEIAEPVQEKPIVIAPEIVEPVQEKPIVIATKIVEPVQKISIKSVETTAATPGFGFVTTRSVYSEPEAAIAPESVLPKDEIEVESFSTTDVSDIVTEEIPQPPVKTSFLGKLKASLIKTKDTLTRKISWIISSKTTIDEEVLEELESALYTSDIGVKTTDLIMKNIRQSVKEQRYKETLELKAIIKKEITNLVKSNNDLANAEFSDKPHVVLVVGVNGNGKTTTIGKLAHYYKKMGKSVLIGAADTFRAAAIEQLEVWAERAGCDVIKQQMGADPAAVAYNAYEAAISRKIDVLLIDTAGRLQNKINLMNELEKISRVLKKFNPQAPHDVLLVLDATTGQNALSQARIFTESTGVTGLVLTKLDGTAKGGVAIAINQELDIPVKFIGIGEKIDDLAVFDINDYVQAIFD